METNNPYDIPAWLDCTGWTKIENLEEYKLAQQIVQGIQNAYAEVNEKPRWSAWYDQVSRSSSSVLLNMAEALGRGRGYYGNSMFIARGELAETSASLSIGPKNICDPLKPAALRLYKLISERISNTPTK